MGKFNFKDNLKNIARKGTLSDLIANENEPDEWLSTNVVVMNLVFSGLLDGGIKKGKINTICAPSAEGKSLIGLNVLKSAQKSGMDCLVIDSERAFPFGVARSLGINMDNIPVYQATGIGDIKQIYALINDGATAKERRNIFVLFDSWGPLVFTGLLDKAEKGTDTADMGRTANFKNELANIINAYGNTTFCINHVYDSMAMYGEKFCIPGGKRLFFLSDGIGLALSEAQWKNPADDSYWGKLVTMSVKKGRSARERAKVQFGLRANGALDPFYGLFDDAMECGVLKKSKPGRYVRNFEIVDKQTGEDISDIDIISGEVKKEWSEVEMYDPMKEPMFWVPIFQNEVFKSFVQGKYTYESDDMISSKYDVVDMMRGIQKIPSEDELYDEVANDVPEGNIENIDKLKVTEESTKKSKK